MPRPRGVLARSLGRVTVPAAHARFRSDSDGSAVPAARRRHHDDTLLHVAGFLPTARDLLSLQLACPRFAAKVIGAVPSVGSAPASGGAAAAAPEMLCIPAEAGRLWVAGCSEQERGWVPRRELESLLGLVQEVELLRVSLLFGRAHANATVSLRQGRWRRGAVPVPGRRRRARWRCGRGVTSRSSQRRGVTL